MKHFSRFLLLLLLWGLLPAGLRAQAQAQNLNAAPTDSLTQKLTSIFANLDKSQVPTGYLYEAGNRFTSLTPYNGTLTDSSVTTLTTWRLLYASLVSGNVGRASYVTPLPDLNAALAAQVAARPGGPTGLTKFWQTV